MKIIVSTQNLCLAIEKALNNNSSEPVIIKNNTIDFGNDILVKGDYWKKGDSYKCLFDKPLFTELANFLKQLPKQPVVVEFEVYANIDIVKKPKINLSQISKSFV
jgi:hypothetical protein